MLLGNLFTEFSGSFAFTLMTVLPNLFAATESVTGNVQEGLKFVGAGLSTTGILGAGVGQGFIGGSSCLAVGRNPEAKGQIMQVMFIMAGIAESGAIYALVIAMLVMFVI